MNTPSSFEYVNDPQPQLAHGLGHAMRQELAHGWSDYIYRVWTCMFVCVCKYIFTYIYIYIYVHA